MKEQIKGLILMLGLILLIYGACCLAEWISTIITMEVLSKLIYVAGFILIVIFIRKEKKNDF